MLHAKIQTHRPSGSAEEDFLKFFAIYSHGGHLLFPLPKDAPGADNLLGPKYFLKHKSSVHLLISSKFSAI